jgi:hypothetical protein
LINPPGIQAQELTGMFGLHLLIRFILICCGTYITTAEVTRNSAAVKVVTILLNSGNNDENIVLRTELLDPSGRAAASATSNSKIFITSAIGD